MRHVNYADAGSYFVTIFARDRLCLFGSVVHGKVVLSTCGSIVEDCWKQLPQRFAGLALDEFVVMPNHVHGIVVLEAEAGAMNRAPTLGEVVRSFKALCTAAVRCESRSGQSLWQRNYYDHVIRNDADLARVREYIADNPRRWDEDEENPASRCDA